MTMGTVQSKWQQINGSNMLVLVRETGETVALPIEQVYQILNPVVIDQDGAPTFLVDVTDAITPQQKQALYNTPTPRFVSSPYRITYAELASISQTGKPVIEALQTQSNTQSINLAGAMTGLAGVASLGARSTNSITSGVNSISNGVGNLQNIDSISDVSRGTNQLSNGLNRFANLTNNGNAAVDATQSTDDRNFFLSAGNWLDNSLFGSIADLMPIDMLKKAVKMIGGCISGLFKTLGYIIEGEWDKAGSVGLSWLKDAAVTGALTYGAYYLGKELNLFGKEEEDENTSSNSGSNSNDNSNDNSNNTPTVNVSISKEDSLELVHRPSSNSTPVAVLDQAGKIITTGQSHLSGTSTILNNGNSSTVFEYTINQKVDTK